MGQPRDTPAITAKSRDITSKSREITSRSRDVTLGPPGSVTKSTVAAPTPSAIQNITQPSTKLSEEPRPGIKFSCKKDDDYYHQYRISKLAEPKQPCSRKKRRRKKTSKTPPEESLYYPVRIDNYFSPTSSTPDSGFVEDPVSPPPDDVNLLKVDELNKLEIVSVHSEESPSPEKVVEEPRYVPEKTEVGAKTVRFSDNISYDTEHNSVSFGNTLEQLRSCIKVKNLQRY